MTFVITFQNRLHRSQKITAIFLCFRIGGKGNKTKKFYDTDGWILDHTRWILKTTERYGACSFLHLIGFF